VRLRPVPLRWMAPATATAAAAGFLLGIRPLFPVACLLPAWPTMVAHLLEGRRARAVASMLIWAASLAATGVTLFLVWPARAEAVVWHGPQYAAQMFDWLRTGVGAESDPRLFLPQHALHLVLFAALSLATASLASLFFGVLLLNYMSFYVSRVIAATHAHPLALAMAWHPWSLLRVASFVILGVVLSEPLLRRVTGKGPEPGGRAPWLGAAAAGLAADAVLKAALAPAWRVWLQSVMVMPAGR
jgi:hypothetical protein